jgi:hypothetical protein
MELTNEIDLDILANAMELIVYEYGNELKPYGIQVCEQLVASLSNVLKNSGEDHDLEFQEDISLTSIGLLKTISSLVLSMEGNSEILPELEKRIIPALQFILTNSLLDVVEEAFELISIFITCQKNVSEGLWNIYPNLYLLLRNVATDYLEEASRVLKNYLYYGSATFRATPVIQAKTFELIQYIVYDQNSKETDIVRALILGENMLLVGKGCIDHV